MDLKIRLRNFRAFEDTAGIDIKPVTVLCGPNSSGKSSILKSILLAKQSGSERRSRYSRNSLPQPLLFNGEWTRLGSWTDVARGKLRDRHIIFNWSAEGTYTEIRKEIEPRYRRNVLEKKDARFFAHIEVEFKSNPDESEEISPALDRYKLTTDKCEIEFSKSTNNAVNFFVGQIAGIGEIVAIGSFYQSLFSPALKEVAGALKSCNEVFQTGNTTIEISSLFLTSVRPRLDKSWAPFFLQLKDVLAQSRASLRGPRPQWYNTFVQAIDEFTEVVQKRPILMLAEIRFPLLFEFVVALYKDLQNLYEQSRAAFAPLWKRVRYLGPLRHQPQRYYQFDDTGGIDIGVSGEHTVQVLALESNNRVGIRKLQNNPAGELFYLTGRRTSLLSATNYWLNYMGLPTVAPETLRHSLYELKVGELEIALPDVGFGVSQVLPVIVEALRAVPGEIVLLEQPEIHLHPRIQTALADFVLARSHDGVKFVIETHSEYFIKRLCRRVAEATLVDVANSINIVFVETDGSGLSTCQKIQISEYGEIKNWPKGFFDVNEDLYWTRASLKKRASNAVRPQ